MRWAAALLAAGSLALAAAPAQAQTPGSAATGTVVDPNTVTVPSSQTRPPAGHRLSARRALAIANREEKVIGAKAKHPGTIGTAYLKGADRWQVSYRDRKGDEVAQAIVDDRTGAVLEAYSGYQVAWYMARGIPGAFGRKATALWIWIPLCVAFVLPFFDWRRPLRMLHLDLLAIVGFSASLAFFNHADIGASVPLVYPFLAYLLARMLWVGFGRSRAGGPLKVLVPATWLLVGATFLFGFRVGLNITNSNVIDVGYAGVVGADRLTHGLELYGAFPADIPTGDTYGPVTYVTYVPATELLGWSGRWDDLPAAHLTALAFDALTALGLWLLGRRVRGPTLGAALAYAWLACPWTLYVSNSNSNDSLVALLLVAVLLVVTSPPARGALAAIAGLAKFAPLALAPMLATYRGGSRVGDAGPPVPPGLRPLLGFGLAFAAAAAVALVPVFVGGGDLSTFYDRTIRSQVDRESPFSIWGYYGGLGWLQDVVRYATIALAFALALVPRRRDIVQLAALGAAVLIALQLGLTHWFYLYIVWFLPFVLLALLARYRDPAEPPAPAPAAAAAQRAAAPAAV